MVSEEKDDRFSCLSWQEERRGTSWEDAVENSGLRSLVLGLRAGRERRSQLHPGTKQLGEQRRAEYGWLQGLEAECQGEGRIFYFVRV